MNVDNTGLTDFFSCERHFASLFSITRQGKKRKKRKDYNTPSKHQGDTKPKQDFGTLKKGLVQITVLLSGVCTLYEFDCLPGQRSEIVSRHF